MVRRYGFRDPAYDAANSEIRNMKTDLTPQQEERKKYLRRVTRKWDTARIKAFDNGKQPIRSFDGLTEYRYDHGTGGYHPTRLPVQRKRNFDTMMDNMKRTGIPGLCTNVRDTIHSATLEKRSADFDSLDLEQKRLQLANQSPNYGGIPQSVGIRSVRTYSQLENDPRQKESFGYFFKGILGTVLGRPISHISTDALDHIARVVVGLDISSTKSQEFGEAVAQTYEEYERASNEEFLRASDEWLSEDALTFTQGDLPDV